MDQFAQKRWESLMVFGVHAPVETCTVLVGEMRGNVSLGNKLGALSMLGAVAHEFMHERRDLRRKVAPNGSKKKL